MSLADWRSIANEKEKYAAYLCSREWAEKKESIRQRSHGRCERCTYGNFDACHHLTYIRKYDERLEDLQAICNECHRYVHGKSYIDPALDLIKKIDIAASGVYVYRDGDLHEQVMCPSCGRNRQRLVKAGQSAWDEEYYFGGHQTKLEYAGDCGSKWIVWICSVVGGTYSYVNVLVNCKTVEGNANET